MEVTLRYQSFWFRGFRHARGQQGNQARTRIHGQLLGWHNTRDAGHWSFVWRSQVHGCRRKLFPEHLESPCRRW